MLSKLVSRNVVTTLCQGSSPRSSLHFQQRATASSKSNPAIPFDIQHPMSSKNRNVRGNDLLRHPLYSKGTSFTKEERNTLGIEGLLPARIESMEMQMERCIRQIRSIDNALHKYTYLMLLRDRSEPLYFSLLLKYSTELIPVIYTPTVGEACQKYSDIWRSPRGMYFNPDDMGNFRKMLDNWDEDVDIIVVTDGSRILGLGDLGANGMGIPIGKLALYVVGAGFHPARTLPVMLDVGTNNEILLNDKNYLGYPKRRPDDKTFWKILDEFMAAVKDKWPKALVQFEDFSNDHCFDLVEKYRDRYLCFDDDIQGTGAVIAAGMVNAVKNTGVSFKDQKIVVYGAGSAAVGVADVIVNIMGLEEGIPEHEARKKFYLVDTKGLVTHNRGDKLQAHKIPYARGEFSEQISTLEGVVDAIKPTCLLGLAGSGRAFTEPIIKKMAQFNQSPIIFALSNPTSKAECTAKEAYEWTDGRCVFASGSPFDPVTVNGKLMEPGQGNNMYIFPGLGFGAFLAKSKSITETMVVTAARALASYTTAEDMKNGCVYPGLQKIRAISAHIAAAVMEKSYEEGLAQLHPKPDNLVQYVTERMYNPNFVDITKDQQ